jgi:gamma-butyrobetaine dioxygenase
VPPAFYPAFDRFRTVAEDERNIFRFLLPQDGAVLFDNRRILHARRPFDDPRRHVVGCYFDDDELRGTFRMLARQA